MNQSHNSLAQTLCSMKFAVLMTIAVNARAVVAQDAVQSAELPIAVASIDDSADPISQLTAAVDQQIRNRWQQEGIEPAALADDAEFLRRAYLDVAGKIPPTWAVRAFVADDSAGKRDRVIRELLESPAYISHFTTVWRNTLIPESRSDLQLRQLVPGFDAWLWSRLSENVPYDEFVREVLATPVTRGNASNTLNGAEPTPLAFYQAKMANSESLAAATSRLFLGVRLECAQCHDHPFDQWKQHQFWSFAAFYAGVSQPENAGILAPIDEQPTRRSLTIPDSGKTVQAAFLTGDAPDWTDTSSPRDKLAQWTTSRDNPWFSRMAVNRVWAHLFGRGIVDPVDDFSDSNAPSHPELLDLLAREFAAHGFDLKFLIRAITATEVYQLTSRQTHESQAEPSMFGRMAVKGLTPEQLFDSLAEAIGFYQPYRTNNQLVMDVNSARAEFLNLFRDDNDVPTARETSILQALSMMNGAFIADATSLQDSLTLAAVVDFPLMTDSQRIESLYLAALSRLPTAAERDRLSAYVADGGPRNDPRLALTDVFWALLNCSEFVFNH